MLQLKYSIIFSTVALADILSNLPGITLQNGGVFSGTLDLASDKSARQNLLHNVEEHLLSMRKELHHASHGTCIEFGLFDNLGTGWNEAKLLIFDANGHYESYVPSSTMFTTKVKYCYHHDRRSLSSSIHGSNFGKTFTTSENATLTAALQHFHVKSPYLIHWTVRDLQTGDVYNGNHMTKMVFRFEESSVALISFLDLPPSRLHPKSCSSCLVRMPMSNHFGEFHPDIDDSKSKEAVALRLRELKNINDHKQHMQPQTSTQILSLKTQDIALYGQDDTWYNEDGSGTTYEISNVEGTRILYAGQLCRGEVWGLPCDVILAPGQFVWRVYGATDPHRSKISWQFCGKMGGAASEMLFEINAYGACHALRLTSVPDTLDEYLPQQRTIREHQILLQGAFDIFGLNSLVLDDHERTLLEYFITSAFNDMRTDRGVGNLMLASLVSWQQVVPDGFYRGSAGEVPSVTDRVTFTLPINVSDYGLHNATSMASKELVTHMRRYLSLAMESGAMQSKLHRLTNTNLLLINGFKLVELIRVSDRASSLMSEEWSLYWADTLIAAAVLMGALAGYFVFINVFPVTDKFEKKM